MCHLCSGHYNDNSETNTPASRLSTCILQLVAQQLERTDRFTMGMVSSIFLSSLIQTICATNVPSYIQYFTIVNLMGLERTAQISKNLILKSPFFMWICHKGKQKQKKTGLQNIHLNQKTFMQPTPVTATKNNVDHCVHTALWLSVHCTII